MAWFHRAMASSTSCHGLVSPCHGMPRSALVARKRAPSRDRSPFIVPWLGFTVPWLRVPRAMASSTSCHGLVSPCHGFEYLVPWLGFTVPWLQVPRAMAWFHRAMASSTSYHGLVSPCLGRVPRALAWFHRAWPSTSCLGLVSPCMAEYLVPWLGFTVPWLRVPRAMAWFHRAMASSTSCHGLVLPCHGFEYLVPWLGFTVPRPSTSCLGLVSPSMAEYLLPWLGFTVHGFEYLVPWLGFTVPWLRVPRAMAW